MSVDVLAPPPAALTPVEPRKRPSWRRPAIVLLALVGVVSVVGSAKEHYERAVRLEPLRAAERAADATGRPIRVIGPGQVSQMGMQGPTESKLAAMLGPGNGYLEAAFYNVQTVSPHPVGDRCYYLAVAPGGVFDADEVTMVGQICYVDAYPRPQSVAFVSPFLPRDR